MDDSFAAITNALADELARERSEEHEGEAREIVAAGDAARPFVDELRRVPAGEVVTIVAADGVPLRGRVVRVGADWIRIGEVADDLGSGRARLLRVHDVRLDAVVRLVRDARE